MFNTYVKKLEVNSQEVIDIVRLLGYFGLKFDVGDEYFKVNEDDPQRKEWFRQFTIYGTRKQLTEFSKAQRFIVCYHMH